MGSGRARGLGSGVDAARGRTTERYGDGRDAGL